VAGKKVCGSNPTRFVTPNFDLITTPSQSSGSTARVKPYVEVPHVGPGSMEGVKVRKQQATLAHAKAELKTLTSRRAGLLHTLSGSISSP
jgi:hypothetical protein